MSHHRKILAILSIVWASSAGTAAYAQVPTENTASPEALKEFLEDDDAVFDAPVLKLPRPEKGRDVKRDLSMFEDGGLITPQSLDQHAPATETNADADEAPSADSKAASETPITADAEAKTTPQEKVVRDHFGSEWELVG